MTGPEAIGTEFSRVLTRWNPSGIRRLRAALDAPDPHPRVRVVADHGADVDGVVGRLHDCCPELHRDDSPAGVALVVLDASAPIGRAMLTRLKQLPDSVRAVVVLDGIDRHQDWDVVAARNRTLLVHHVPRLSAVPIRPVASRMVDGGSEIVTDLAAATSGTAAQWEARNLLCLVDDVVGEARRSLTAHARTAGQDANLATARAERAALESGRSRTGDRMNLVRSRIQKIRLGALHDVGVEIRAVASEATHTINDANAAALRRFPDEFTRDVECSADRVDRSVVDELDALGRDLGVPDAGPTTVIPPADVDVDVPPRSPGADEWLAGLLGVSAGAGCARLLGALTGPSPLVSWLLTAVLAVAVGGTTLAVRRRAAARAHLRRWAAEVVADARPRWEQSILSALLDAESVVTAALTAHAREQSDAVAARVASVDDRIRTHAAALAGRNAAYERDLAALERGADAVRRAVEPSGLGGASKPIGAVLSRR